MTLARKLTIAVAAFLLAVLSTWGVALLGYRVARAEAAPIADVETLAQTVYRGVTSGDWFLVAGAALCLATIGARWLLAKKWPRVESDLWGVTLVAVMAGVGGLGNAWIAGEDLGTHTLLGAVKVWAAAVFQYVTAKKLFSSLAKAT